MVSTSALLLGVPWALAFGEEQQVQEMEREMQMQRNANEVSTLCAGDGMATTLRCRDIDDVVTASYARDWGSEAGSVAEQKCLKIALCTSCCIIYSAHVKSGPVLQRSKPNHLRFIKDPQRFECEASFSSS